LCNKVDAVRDTGVKEDFETFEYIMGLPANYKIVMILYYIESYRSAEFAGIININEDAVRKHFQKGSELPENELEKRSNTMN
jgi:DNA-directed RNA polymerase specialized sigma24 family protein